MKFTRTLSALFLITAVVTPPAPAAETNPFVYFGTYTKEGGSKGIYRSTLDLATGNLSEPELAAEIESPSFVALHPTRPVLYAVIENGAAPAETNALNAFAIDPKSGALRHLNAQSTGGAAACHVSLDPSGNVVLAANYTGGNITSALVKEDGSLSAPASFIQHVGSSVIPGRQAAPHAHSINVSPDGRWALVADLGLDQILVYKLDAKTAILTPNDPPFTKTGGGTGPRHLSFHPSGKFAFSNNEITSSVTAYAFDSQSGTLAPIETESTLPADYKKKGNSTAECLVHPSGKFLYVSNRGHNSIAVFAIEPDSGKLTPVEIEPTGGEIPRGFGIDPTGTYLVAANQQSDDIHVFRIDPKSGALDPTGNSISVSSPVNVRFYVPE